MSGNVRLSDTLRGRSRVADEAAVPASFVPRQPGRGFSWAPFAPGHELSMQHGAYSPRRVDPLAQQIIEEVARSVTWWRPCDMPAVWSWGRAEAKAQLFTEYLAKAGEAAGDGIGDLEADRIQTAYRLLHQAETRAANMRKQLGLDPLSRARLGRDVAATQVDVARMMAQPAPTDEGPDDGS